MRPPLLVVATALAWLVAPRLAWGFCQTYTCEFDGRQVCSIDPFTGCPTGGQIARWGTDCISYAVQSEGSLAREISADALRGIVEEGFATWSDSVCEGRGPGEMTPMFAAAYRGQTSCDVVEYNCSEPVNDNIVMFRDGDSDLSANTIALSTIIANLSTGEILDVDIEINSRDFDFSIDPARVSAGAHDLRLVVNHELGHLLGLSHSRDGGALMRAEYEGSNPLPTRDDARGICNVFPVSGADPECSAPPIEGGGDCLGSASICQISGPTRSGSCGLAVPQQAGGWGWLLPAAAFGAGLVRRGLPGPLRGSGRERFARGRRRL
jgi:matrixin